MLFSFCPIRLDESRSALWWTSSCALTDDGVHQSALVGPPRRVSCLFLLSSRAKRRISETVCRFSIYMEIGVSTLHPLHRDSQNVIQRSGATKNLVYIKEWVFSISFTSLWMTIKEHVKNPPFHRKVNRVKGSGANFYVYTRARELGLFLSK